MAYSATHHHCPLRGHPVHVWPTRHRAKRFIAISGGLSVAQVASAILEKRAWMQNPDKDEVLVRAGSA
jgi:hypothetical protein